MAYLLLVYRELFRSWPAAPIRALLALALPALLCAILFVTFVLIPLWHWLRGAQRPTMFIVAGSAAWLLATALLLITTASSVSEGIAAAVQLAIPGLLLVAVFGLTAKAV